MSAQATAMMAKMIGKILSAGGIMMDPKPKVLVRSETVSGITSTKKAARRS